MVKDQSMQVHVRGLGTSVISKECTHKCSLLWSGGNKTCCLTLKGTMMTYSRRKLYTSNL